ncbi:hypothetical protein B0H63DRAFT_559217 [Podospora didyma]|uniref:Uncharacterized protein n=1 Tax=Podospora didyma TaxID=330526 RepID=A0AAE0NU86_9PEZI|nr:hypothetical protein B0H63DRAFT_559217 [Podospora didyma]
MARLITSLAAMSLIGAPLAQAVVLPKRQAGAFEFMQKTCDITQDIGKLPSVRWKEAQADATLTWANRNWNEVPGSHGDTNLDYLNTMFRLFGKPTANCHIADGSCDFSSEVCIDRNHLAKGEQPTVGKTPGAWAIRQSLSHIHSYFLTLYNAVGGGSTEFSAQMGPFLDDFSPAKKPDLAEKFIDAINAFILDKAFEVALGAGVGRFLSSVGEEAQNAIKEATTALKDYAVEQLKTEQPTQDDKAKGLTALLTAAVVRFKASVSSYVDHIFSGRADGAMSDLRDVITNGQWLEDHVKSAGNLGGLEGVMKTAFAATLVANAWKITENIYPVILMENTDCDMGEPSVLMPAAVTHTGGSCIVSGKTMFLVGLNTGECYIPPSSGTNKRGDLDNSTFVSEFSLSRRDGVGPGCDDTFKTLPGLDKLGDWGLNKDDIILSAWNTYQANDGKNGGDVSGDYFHDGLKAQGLYQIPICEIKEAEKTIVRNSGGTSPICDYGGW